MISKIILSEIKSAPCKNYIHLPEQPKLLILLNIISITIKLVLLSTKVWKLFKTLNFLDYNL